MKPIPYFCAALCLLVCGCLNLKPVQQNTRYFVLSAGSPSNSVPAAALVPGPALGLGPIRLAPYLYKHFLAVRRGPNEIDYLEANQWAEGLEHGFQRALGQDLLARLPGQQFRFSAWRAEDVRLEIYMDVEQFDVDTQGQGVLLARWRIRAPGQEKPPRTGEIRLSRHGPAPGADPAGAVGTLSQLVAELSGIVARALSGPVAD